MTNEELNKRVESINERIDALVEKTEQEFIDSVIAEVNANE